MVGVTPPPPDICSREISGRFQVDFQVNSGRFAEDIQINSRKFR
jgi:hypothetical protein